MGQKLQNETNLDRNFFQADRMTSVLMTPIWLSHVPLIRVADSTTFNKLRRPPLTLHVSPLQRNAYKFKQYQHINISALLICNWKDWQTGWSTIWTSWARWTDKCQYIVIAADFEDLPCFLGSLTCVLYLVIHPANAYNCILTCDVTTDIFAYIKLPTKWPMLCWLGN